MPEKVKFYICLTCYRVCEESGECHEHRMLLCCPGEAGTERRKPLRDASGRIQSRAPRWFLEATGWIQARGRYTSFP